MYKYLKDTLEHIESYANYYGKILTIRHLQDDIYEALIEKIPVYIPGSGNVAQKE